MKINYPPLFWFGLGFITIITITAAFIWIMAKIYKHPEDCQGTLPQIIAYTFLGLVAIYISVL